MIKRKELVSHTTMKMILKYKLLSERSNSEKSYIYPITPLLGPSTCGKTTARMNILMTDGNLNQGRGWNRHS